MQEALHYVHEHKDAYCKCAECQVANPKGEETTSNAFDLQGGFQCVGEEDCGQLGVSK